jgi:hypothetical protein
MSTRHSHSKESAERRIALLCAQLFAAAIVRSRVTVQPVDIWTSHIGIRCIIKTRIDLCPTIWRHRRKPQLICRPRQVKFLLYRKISSFRFTELRGYLLHPALMKRGVWPIVTKRGARDAMDAARHRTIDVCRGRQRRVVLAPLGWR